MSCVTSQNASQAIPVTRGASKTIIVTVRDLNKQPVALTGAKVWFTVKNRVEDAGAIISKKNVAAGGVDGQILITIPQIGSVVGQFQIFLDPADTAGLDPDASYWCDSWVQLITGVRYQVLSNRSFQINPTVTTSFI